MSSVPISVRALQDQFTEHVYPRVLRRARFATRKWKAWTREELTADALGHAWRIVVSLDRRGRDPFATPWTVARYAVQKAREAFRPLTGGRPLPGELADVRASDPSARAALADWLRAQPDGRRRLAGWLGVGLSLAEAADELGVSRCHASKLRRRLRDDYYHASN